MNVVKRTTQNFCFWLLCKRVWGKRIGAVLMRNAGLEG